jgi:tetratricopeptide (TPR) repeat protein
LVNTARECLLKGMLYQGLDAYKKAETSPPEEELTICGNVCFRQGQLGHGLEAYKAANKTPPEEELMACGNKCLDEGQSIRGLEAYEIINKIPPKEKLIACAKKCLYEQRHDEAKKLITKAHQLYPEVSEERLFGPLQTHL